MTGGNEKAAGPVDGWPGGWRLGERSAGRV